MTAPRSDATGSSTASVSKRTCAGTFSHYPDLTEDVVIGKLPGMTDENIVMIAHVDGYFDGADDDGAGTAALLGTADYFAKLPKEQRRRTMYFVSLPDHHGGDHGGAWLHDNFKAIFAKTA